MFCCHPPTQLWDETHCGSCDAAVGYRQPRSLFKSFKFSTARKTRQVFVSVSEAERWATQIQWKEKGKLRPFVQAMEFKLIHINCKIEYLFIIASNHFNSLNTVKNATRRRKRHYHPNQNANPYLLWWRVTTFTFAHVLD